MAKAKVKKTKAPKGKKKKKKKGKKQGKVQLFLIVSILLSAVFLPTAVMIFIGMVPSFVAYFTDRTKKKTRAVTIIMMNFAGCMPFLMEMWTTDHSLDKAFAMIFNMIPIIVMYSAAAVGYLIDWAMTHIVASVMYQRGVSRVKNIEKRQQELVERWGDDVKAAVPKKPEPLLPEDDLNIKKA